MSTTYSSAVPLREYVSRYPMTEAAVVKLGSDLGNAIRRLHEQNMLHLDICPDNIYYDVQNNSFFPGDPDRSKFDSRFTTEERLEQGVYDYSAPEMYRGKEIGASADIYSLALILYEQLNNGSLPFLKNRMSTPEEGVEAVRLRMTGRTVPPPSSGSIRLISCLLKALSFKPADRYSSDTAFLTALKDSLDDGYSDSQRTSGYADNSKSRAGTSYSGGASSYGRSDSSYSRETSSYGRSDSSYSRDTSSYGRTDSSYNGGSSSYDRSSVHEAGYGSASSQRTAGGTQAAGSDSSAHGGFRSAGSTGRSAGWAGEGASSGTRTAGAGTGTSETGRGGTTGSGKGSGSGKPANSSGSKRTIIALIIAAVLGIGGYMIWQSAGDSGLNPNNGGSAGTQTSSSKNIIPTVALTEKYVSGVFSETTTDGPFSYKYPSNWGASKESGDGYEQVFYFPMASDENTFIVVTVNTANYNIDNCTEEELDDRYETAIDSLLQDEDLSAFTVERLETTELSGQRCKYISFSADENGQKTIGEGYLIGSANKFYQFYCMGTEENYQKIIDDFQTMIDSLTIDTAYELPYTSAEFTEAVTIGDVTYYAPSNWLTDSSTNTENSTAYYAYGVFDQAYILVTTEALSYSVADYTDDDLYKGYMNLADTYSNSEGYMLKEKEQLTISGYPAYHIVLQYPYESQTMEADFYYMAIGSTLYYFEYDEVDHVNSAAKEDMKRFISMIKINTDTTAAVSSKAETTNVTTSADSGYTDDELCEMALDYYEKHENYRPGIAEIDSIDGDYVSIHLYDNMDTHTATAAWYRINRYTAKGTDTIFGNEIDLLN